MLPALEAGKNVFVEWPLGQNLAEAEEMAALAKSANVTTAVGLQARQAPSIRKVNSQSASECWSIDGSDDSDIGKRDY